MDFTTKLAEGGGGCQLFHLFPIVPLNLIFRQFKENFDKFNAWNY